MTAFIASLLAIALLPQEPSLKAVKGRVRHLDGRPVAGADVVLLHRPLWNCWEAPGEHRVQARSDDAGMFRAELREGRSYSVWASWATGATACEEGVMAGDFVALTAHVLARPCRKRVTGSEAWAEVGPLQYRVLVGSENVDLLPVPCADSVLDLPALPPTQYAIVEVLDRNGEVLWAAHPDPEGDGAVIAIPAPFAVELTVRDAGGAAMAGVPILRHIRNYWITSSPGVLPGDRFRALWPVCGVTGEDGTLRVRVPVDERAGADQAPQRLLFLARKTGFRASLGGWSYGKVYRNGQAAEPGPLDFTLAKVEPPLEIEAPATLPMRDQPVRLTWRVYARENGGASGLPFMEVASGGAHGVPLAVPLHEDDLLEQAWTVLPDSVRAPLLAKHGCTLPFAVRLTVARSRKPGQLQFSTESLRLIQVAEEGRPADRAVVLVSPMVKGQPQPERGTLLRTDRLGRALVQVGEGGVHVAVVTDASAGAGLLRPDGKSPWILQLQPLRHADGIVVDEAGAPVAKVQVQTFQFQPTRSAGPVDEGITASEMAFLFRSLPPAVTGADGRFRLAYVPNEATLSLEVVEAFGRVRLKQPALFECTAEKPEPISLTVVPAGR